ncbi:PREDICTED: zinc finger protein 628-like isoform X1 [Branchiostoma belcheri]|uniref:Zinc finger protein 628-like isoform X1 n=1 Tax=Branchiostoma belcheri TaxID=7741 RepID=A0A6P4ZTG4_BRABE|nr:PREDICTED: zinc finger protein 628-like isoform X1 [Branchiostoma belcheri]
MMGQGAGKNKKGAEQQPGAEDAGKAAEDAGKAAEDAGKGAELAPAVTATRRTTRASLTATETDVLEVSFKGQQGSGEQPSGLAGRKTKSSGATSPAQSPSRKRSRILPSTSSTDQDMEDMALKKKPVVILERLNMSPDQKTVIIPDVSKMGDGAVGFSGTGQIIPSTSSYKEASTSFDASLAIQTSSPTMSPRRKTKRVRFEDKTVGDLSSGATVSDNAQAMKEMTTTSSSVQETSGPSKSVRAPQPSTSKPEATVEAPVSCPPSQRRIKLTARKSTFSGKKPKRVGVQSAVVGTNEDSSENDAAIDQVQKGKEETSTAAFEKTVSSVTTEETVSENVAPEKEGSNDKELPEKIQTSPPEQIHTSPVVSGDHNYVRDSSPVKKPTRAKRKTKSASPKNASENQAVAESGTRRRSSRAPKVKEFGKEFQVDLYSKTTADKEEGDEEHISGKGKEEIPKQQSENEDHSYIIRVSRRKSRKPQKLDVLKADALKLDQENETTVGDEDLTVKEEAEDEERDQTVANEPYYCSECSRSFTRQYTFNLHMATHAGGSKDPKQRKCDHPGCTKTFRLKSHLQEHVAQHQFEDVEMLETKKEVPDQLETAQEEGTEDDPEYKPGIQLVGRGKSRRMVTPWVPCRYPDCKKLFISKRASSKHESHFHQPNPSLRYPCTYQGCDQTFTSRHYQAKHELADHPNDPDMRPHQCPHCPLRFAHTGTLTKHQSVHNRPKDWAPISHKCTQPGCARVFPTPSKLRDHLLSHGVCTTQKYQCETCGKFFPRKGQLKKHIVYTHTDAAHHCTQCDKRFHTDASLARHVTIAHDRKWPLSCKQCGRGFRTKSLLLDHQNIHRENPVKYKCQVCEKEFLVKTYFKQHIRTHDKKLKTHKCSTCDMGFSSGFLLRRHEIRHSGDRMFKCKFCDKTYKHRGAVEHHQKKEHQDQYGKAVDDYLNRFACNVCGRTGHTKQVIEKHIKAVHLNLRDEHCPYKGCNKAFVDQNALRSHIATMHDPSLRPFKCDKCDRSFYRKKQLDWHVFSHNKDLSPHQCDSCGKKFVCARTLREHVDAIHKKIRPYSCSYCSKSFSKQHALEDHQRIHTGEKKWPCDLCDEKFINTHYRKVHKVKVHGMGHQCPQCNLSFMSTLALERHQKRHETERKTTRAYRRRQPRESAAEEDPPVPAVLPATEAVAAEVPSTSQENQAPAASSQSDGEKLNCEFCPESFATFEEWEGHLSKVHKCSVTVLSETGPDAEPVYKAVIQPTSEDGSIPNMTKIPVTQPEPPPKKEETTEVVQEAPSGGGTLVAEAIADESYATKTMLNLIDKLNNEIEQPKEQTETSAIESFDVISGDDYASRTMLSLLDQLSTDAGPTSST